MAVAFRFNPGYQTGYWPPLVGRYPVFVALDERIHAGTVSGAPPTSCPEG
jgi:hypothetical protein